MHSLQRGSGWMWRILDRVVKRKATFSDVELLSDVTKQMRVIQFVLLEKVLLGQFKVC